MITVQKRQYLDALPNKTIGEYAVALEDGHIYQYTENGWGPIQVQGDGLSVSLYDINQNIFAQLQPMNDENLRQVHSQIFKFLGDTMQDYDNDYWALICWQRHYITIFHNDSKLKFEEDSEEISDVLMDILESLGDIKDVTDNGNGALEIWITSNEGTHCYLFFNYKNGVVEGVA